MAKILDGKAVSASVKEQVANETAALKEKGITPGLAVVIVGDDPASHVYVNNKKKACAQVGFHSEEYALPAQTTQEELLALVETLNKSLTSTVSSFSFLCRRTSMKRRLSRRLTRKKTWTRSTLQMSGKS